MDPLRLLGAALLVLALSAARCAGTPDAPAPMPPAPVPPAPRPPQPPPTPGAPFTLARGESATLDGMDITFDAVTEDSRCPEDVDCVWQGRATIRLALRAGDEAGDALPAIMGMTNESVPVEALGHRFTLRALTPYPGASGAPGGASVEATLVVERL